MPDIFKVIGTSLLSLAVLFLLCRLNGQRQISQMSLFDYINSITIGSIAAELATDLENWQRTLTAMAVYGAAIALIGYLTCKSLGLRKLLNGTPLLLFENGNLYKANLLRAKLDVNEFLTQCRVVGYHDLSQLAAVVLETNGQLSFLPKAEQRPATPQDLGLTPLGGSDSGREDSHKKSGRGRAGRTLAAPAAEPVRHRADQRGIPGHV